MDVETRKALIHQVIDSLYGGRYVSVGPVTYRYIAKDFQSIRTAKMGIPSYEGRWQDCGLGAVVDAVESTSEPVVVIEPEYPLKLEDAVMELSHYRKVEARVMKYGKPSYITINPRKPLKVIDQETGEPFTFEGLMIEWRVVE